MHYLYLIRNGKNGKVYVGRTVNPQGRWSNHRGQSQRENSPQYIHRAMKKYGTEHFSFTIIDFAMDRWQAGCLEENYIQQYRSRDKEFGYNVARGGYTDPMTPKRQAALLEGQRKWRERLKAEGKPLPGAYQQGHEGKPNSGGFKKGHTNNLGKHNNPNGYNQHKKAV